MRFQRRSVAKKMLKARGEVSDATVCENFCVCLHEAFSNSKPKEVKDKCVLCSFWLTKR